MLDALEEPFQYRDVEYRLRDGILGASFHLEFEAPHFLFKIGRTRIRALSDHEYRATPDGIASCIEPMVKVVHNIQQADGSHVEHGCCILIIAPAGRISG